MSKNFLSKDGPVRHLDCAAPEARETLLAEYFKRGYQSVDGFWFLMAEQDLGMEAALRLDRDVWRIMPKILARKTMELLDLPRRELRSLSLSLGFKFDAEGYEIKSHVMREDLLEIQITGCPWRRAIIKSDNFSLLPRVAEEVCTVVYETWAGEFLDSFKMEMNPKICTGGDFCCIRVRA